MMEMIQPLIRTEMLYDVEHIVWHKTDRATKSKIYVVK